MLAEDVRVFQSEVLEKTIKVMHLYDNYWKDHEIMDYIEGRVKCKRDHVAGRLRRRKYSGWIELLNQQPPESHLERH